MQAKALCFKNRLEWHHWLAKNHKMEKEAWLIYYKKHTGKDTIPYSDAAEEAICFGWIDSKVRSIDSEKYMQRFTPRREGSAWAEQNIKRARKMIRLGKMTKEGMEKFRRHGKTKIPQIIGMPKEMELKASSTAWDNFRKFPPSHRKVFFWLVNSAKRRETRDRKIRVCYPELIGLFISL